MPIEVLLQTLKDLQRGTLRLGVALGLYALVAPALFLLARAASPVWLNELLFRLSGVTNAVSTPAGWLQAVGFGLVFPLALCLYAIWKGSGLVAGEERSGTLELLMAYPLPRWRLMLEKFAALALALLLLAAELWALLALSVSALGLSVSLGRLAGACLGLWLLALTFGGSAFALSTWVGVPARSRLIAVIALGAAYLLNAVWLHGWQALRYLSPVYYATGREPLTNGLLLWHALALALLAVVCVAAAGVVFEQRDLAV